MGLARWGAGGWGKGGSENKGEKVKREVSGVRRKPKDKHRTAPADDVDYAKALARLRDSRSLPPEFEDLLEAEIDIMRDETREMARLAVLKNTGAEYAEFVEKLNFTPEQKEKLLNIVIGYDLSVAAAREKAEDTEPNVKIPTKEQVIAHIMAMGESKLEKIATVMVKPGLVIETGKSMEEMRQTLDANFHYENQVKTYLSNDYVWSGKQRKGTVSIMDEVQSPDAVPGQDPGKQKNSKQLLICKKHFGQQNEENDPHPIILVSDHTYAAGMQKALLAFKLAKEKGEENPERHIPDYHGKQKKTVTMFNQQKLKFITEVAYGRFSPECGRVHFGWSDPNVGHRRLRGRGSVRVMEFDI